MNAKVENTEKKVKAPKAPTAAARIKILEDIVLTLAERIEELESRPTRDRGPDSERKMTENDARDILLGDMKELSHKKCAEELGLSYGQVYSARNGFTFKGVYKEYRDSKK